MSLAGRGRVRDRAPLHAVDAARNDNGTEDTMADMPHFTIATVAEQNPDFRRVLWTGRHTQLVIMTIPPGGEIGRETHEGTDQLLTFVSGIGEAEVAGQTRQVVQGDLVAVPAGTVHNFRNTGPNPLVLYTVYGPPEHAENAVHATREDAEAAEQSGHDRPPPVSPRAG